MIFLPYFSPLYNWSRMPYSVSPYFVLICNWEEGKPMQDTEGIPYSISWWTNSAQFSLLPIASPYWTNFSLATSKLGRSSLCVFGRVEQADIKQAAAQKFLTQLQSAQAQSVGPYCLHGQGSAQTQANLADNLPAACGCNLLPFKETVVGFCLTARASSKWLYTNLAEDIIHN